MTRRKKHGRTLMGSALALLWCFTMLVGNTFALSSEQEDAIVSADGLDVSMMMLSNIQSPTQDTEWSFTYDNWEPGYTAVRYIRIENGETPIAYQLSFEPVSDNAQVGELAQVIDVYFVGPLTDKITDRALLSWENRVGTLAEVLDGRVVGGLNRLETGEHSVFAVALKMQESAGNAYQNTSAGDGFVIELLAVQANSNT